MELLIVHSDLNRETGETTTTYTFTAVLTAEAKAKAFPCGHTDKDLYVELDQACPHTPSEVFRTVEKVEELVRLFDQAKELHAQASETDESKRGDVDQP